jgi:hypothetical protein
MEDSSLEDRERQEPEGERAMQADAAQAQRAMSTRKRKNRKRQGGMCFRIVFLHSATAFRTDGGEGRGHCMYEYTHTLEHVSVRYRPSHHTVNVPSYHAVRQCGTASSAFCLVYNAVTLGTLLISVYHWLALLSNRMAFYYHIFPWPSSVHGLIL